MIHILNVEKENVIKVGKKIKNSQSNDIHNLIKKYTDLIEFIKIATEKIPYLTASNNNTPQLLGSNTPQLLGSNTQQLLGSNTQQLLGSNNIEGLVQKFIDTKSIIINTFETEQINVYKLYVKSNNKRSQEQLTELSNRYYALISVINQHNWG